MPPRACLEIFPACSSNGSLTLGGATPSISNLSRNPNAPVVGQQFTLTINGSTFDPNDISMARHWVPGTVPDKPGQ